MKNTGLNKPHKAQAFLHVLVLVDRREHGLGRVHFCIHVLVHASQYEL